MKKEDKIERLINSALEVLHHDGCGGDYELYELMKSQLRWRFIKVLGWKLPEKKEESDNG